MKWSEQISEGMPEPREGEPKALRRDIADELADHLAEALGRERASHKDEARAEKAVLERFGDPRKIARRLWWDAMKERIMRERILISAMIVLALACAGLAGLTWVSIRQNRDVNQAMLLAIERIGSRPEREPAAAAERMLVRATIRVVEGDENGPPISDLRVSLSGKAFSEDTPTLDEQTDEEGIARFGPIRPGRYRLEVSRRTEDDVRLEYSDRLTLYSGDEREELVIVPTLEMTDVSIAVELPEGFEREDLLYEFGFSGRVEVDRVRWKVIPPSVLIDRAGEVFQRGASDAMRHSPPKRIVRWPVASYMSRTLYVSVARDHAGGEGSYEHGKYTAEIAKGKVGKFEAAAGVLNEWTLSLSDERFKKKNFYPPPEAAQPKALAKRNAELAALVEGTIQKYIPIALDTTISAQEPHMRYGDEGSLGLGNSDRGMRTLLRWEDRAPFSGEENMNRRFVLALYARNVTGAATFAALTAHEILDPWPEDVSWSRQPATGSQAAATFDFPGEEGWWFFDLTPLLSEQAKAGRVNKGVEIAFEEEFGDAYAEPLGCVFFSREARGADAARRPVLLIVDQGEPGSPGD